MSEACGHLRVAVPCEAVVPTRRLSLTRLEPEARGEKLFTGDIFMSNLVFLRDGQAVTTSEAIASGVSIQHKNLLSILRTYQSDFEAFGTVAFETRGSNGSAGYQVFAVLNEQQATLLVTYCKNTEVVRRFKVALVKAFYDARNPQTLTPDEQYRIQQAVAERARKSSESFRTIY